MDKPTRPIDQRRRDEDGAVVTTELARERNREAADRTLLAWIRTSLAMVSLGFGIERFGQAAVGLDGGGFSPLKTRFYGATLMALGIVATLAGMWEHRLVLRAIAGDAYRYADRTPIARWLGAGLVIVGIAGLAAMLFAT
jgi:putative membrane protein